MLDPNESFAYSGSDEADAEAQGAFLRDAMRRLRKSRTEFAERFGVSKKSLDNWLAPQYSAEFRRMPLMAWKFIRETVARECG